MTLVRAVLRYRYKFIDCAAGAVPNNRHDLDLLSDDDCRGAWGQLVMTRPNPGCVVTSPGPSFPMRAGRDASAIRPLRALE